jgi:hypothetical protein
MTDLEVDIIANLADHVLRGTLAAIPRRPACLFRRRRRPQNLAAPQSKSAGKIWDEHVSAGIGATHIDQFP